MTLMCFFKNPWKQYAYLNEVSAQHLLPRKARDPCRLVVPLVHKTIRVDTKDRRVCCVDEGLQLLRHTRLLDLHLLALRDVLADSDNTNYITTDVSTGGGIQKNLYSALVLGVQRKLEVRRLTPLQSIVKDLLDSYLVFLSDEVLKGKKMESNIKTDRQ